MPNLCYGMLIIPFTSGPPAPYQPQGWGNGYPHWQQGQPDPSGYLLLVKLQITTGSNILKQSCKTKFFRFIM